MNNDGIVLESTILDLCIELVKLSSEYLNS